MKKNQLIIILALAALIIAGIFAWSFLSEREEKEPVVSKDVIPADAEENFYSYLELASFSGKLLRFDEDKSEIHIFYFDREINKTASRVFKIDQETIFSKALFEPGQPDLFPGKELKKVKEETYTTVSYLPAEKENEIPLARLIRVKASF